MTRRTVFLSVFVCAAAVYAQEKVTVVNAARGSTVVAPDSLVSAFGTGLSAQTLSATSVPLPQALGDVRVTVQDASGTVHPAGLIYVSPSQINFAMPAGTGGTNFVTVNGTSGVVAAGSVYVQPVAPGLFSADGTGTGVAAAIGIRVVDVVGPHVEFPVYSCKGTVCTPLPIDTGLDSPVFLALFGTGFRNAKKVTVTVGGQSVPVQYAGPQGYPGLDQVNIGVPLSLRGAGVVNVVLTADGQDSNPVQVQIQ